MSKIFSIPLNPMLSEQAFTHVFYPFLQKNKDWIYDIYFTCRIPPFTQDAMGSVINEDDRYSVFDNALMIQETLGIKISATFNNFNVSP
jgi:hypothetical protein